MYIFCIIRVVASIFVHLVGAVQSYPSSGMFSDFYAIFPMFLDASFQFSIIFLLFTLAIIPGRDNAAHCVYDVFSIAMLNCLSICGECMKAATYVGKGRADLA